MRRLALLMLVVPAAILLCASPLSAQQTPAVVGSTVTGHVTCADTNAPARFARILLKSTQPDHAGDDFMKQIQENMPKNVPESTSTTEQADSPPTPVVKPTDEEQQATMDAASKGMSQLMDMLNSSTVGMDGAYSFAGIKAGTYYVHASMPGYIDPYLQFSDKDFSSADPAIRARIAQIPTITVNGADAAHIDLRLERGAAINGHVFFDDGSPAVGWTLSVIKTGAPDDLENPTSMLMAQALALGGGGVQVSKTDDLGQFRLCGLAAGEYAVRATLLASAVGISATNIGDGGSGINLNVYSGNTFSRADAKPVKVTAGEEYSDLDLTVPEHALHNIIGHVYAKSDGHTLNVGDVVLTSKSNSALHLKAAIRDDGSFHFEYLPTAVTYTLTVEDAADGSNTGPQTNVMGINIPNPQILHRYGTDTTDVMLTDADIDSVRLTVSQTDTTTKTPQ